MSRMSISQSSHDKTYDTAVSNPEPEPVFISKEGSMTSIGVMALVVIIMVLEGFYIKHYYFLENTVQEMYRVYDSMLEKRRSLRAGEDKK